MITYFLPHLTSLSPSPASIILVSSGLAIIPFPRCANYSASKAALRSLAWSLRTQLAGQDETRHIRVIELIPPAVQTELHPSQADLVALGQDKIGIPLEKYIDETWRELNPEEGGEIKDDIVHSAHGGRMDGIEGLRREGYEAFLAAMRKMGVKI